MSEEQHDSSPRKRNIVVGKAQGEWGDTLPGAEVDTLSSAEDHTTKATHPPIIGIEEMPQTIGELRASVLYCTLLYQTAHPLLLGVLATNPELGRQTSERRVAGLKRDIPEMAPTLDAYQAGDMERLREIHRTSMTFAEMLRHYDADEDGWVPTHLL